MLRVVSHFRASSLGFMTLASGGFEFSFVGHRGYADFITCMPLM